MIDYYETNWQDTVGYMEWNLDALRGRVEFNSLLDIGAAHGDFSKMMHDMFGIKDITMVEANDLDSFYLERLPYKTIYTALGAKNGTQTFYTNPDDPVGGGSSLYLENTDWFENANEEEMEVQTLDSLGVKADFIKIDVQGAELDVIKGGKETIKNAKLLLLELSFLDYNLKAPLIDDVLEETRKLGFRMIDTFGPVKGGHVFNGKKNQVDVLLARNDIEELYKV